MGEGDSCRAVTPFDDFARTLGLGAADLRRFYDYVLACGGGAHTDGTTLAKLFDIWNALGRHG